MAGNGGGEWSSGSGGGGCIAAVFGGLR